MFRHDLASDVGQSVTDTKDAQKPSESLASYVSQVGAAVVRAQHRQLVRTTRRHP